MDEWYDDGSGAAQTTGMHNRQHHSPGPHMGASGGVGMGAGGVNAMPGGYASAPTSYGFGSPGTRTAALGQVGMQGSDYAGRSSFTPPPSSVLAGTSIGGPMGGYAGGPVGGGGSVGFIDEFANEPPLLEELGINFDHIWSKTQAVVVPTKQIDISYLDDTDLAGPLVFGLIFGAALLVRAKVHFGYIYGFGLFGCIAITLVLNLLGDKPIDVWRTCSVLGYSLLPVIALALLDIPLDLHGKIGLIFCPLAVCWSTYSSVRLFVQYLNMRHQRWLIAYPVGLLYACFVLITIF